MHSYIRQATVSADQLHSFLRDKLAWENAITMYQGPDPLDHWYNYICWYENRSSGDPENKFRETLERCLTLYEHNDFYKQDPRMVRLWIKYIDMQPNPLHFYQVLYQRGVGRQMSTFYISWAGYYESISAFKEAESVYNLGFQEKAQSYAELHHAHSKLMYAKSAVNLMQHQHKPLHTHPQQEQQQSQYLSHQNIHLQSPIQTQIQFQHSVPQGYLQDTSHQQQQEHICQQHQAQIQHTQQQQLYEQQHSEYQCQTQQQLHLQTDVACGSVHLPAQNYIQSCNDENVPTHVPINQERLEEVYTHDAEYPQPCESVSISNDSIQADITVKGIKLPRKFASYCRNNYETWKPALFLEEPEDPCRRCHYAKHLVYPTGTITEYSPEELRARRYGRELNMEKHVSKNGENNMNSLSNELKEHQELQEIGYGEHLPVESGLVQNEQMQSQGVEYKEYSAHDIRRNDKETEKTETFDNNNDVNGDNPERKEAVDPNNYEDQSDKRCQELVSAIASTNDDLEDQIEASTIRFSMHSAQQGIQNKTIKIKFKKERKIGGGSLNGSNYSAYTIESVFQPEVESFCTGQEDAIRGNGHNFHPYMLDRTSTPKYNSKRGKSKLKRPNSKFQIAACSSSNSSSIENVIANGANHTPAENVQTCENVIQNDTFNDNANYSFSCEVAHENSNCSLTNAVGRLNFRDVSVASANTNTVPVADFSTYQENSYFATQHDTEAKERRLQKALETIDRHLVKEAIDPFNSELCRAFLTKLDFPGTNDSHANYKIIQTPLPKIANTRTLNLPDGVTFNIDKEVGRGSYGSVYKATDVNSGAIVALKFQKPPNTWEIYICDQVLKRVTDENVLPGLMDVSTAIIAPNASLIATEFSTFGSLLDINNKIRQATTKVMHESLVMHFSSQICNIIHHLHRKKIIHADIKPDNFLLMRIPNADLHYPSLRLIDFGCAIDMTLFPAGDQTKFRKVIQTDGFTCIEMQEGRPWSYETDLFCIAGTVHVMLLGEYMQLQKRAATWDIKQKLPRYLKKHVWMRFFGEMLNIQFDKLPNLDELRRTFVEEATKMDSELQNQIRMLSNILYRR